MSSSRCPMTRVSLTPAPSDVGWPRTVRTTRRLAGAGRVMAISEERTLRRKMRAIPSENKRRGANAACRTRDNARLRREADRAESGQDRVAMPYPAGHFRLDAAVAQEIERRHRPAVDHRPLA